MPHTRPMDPTQDGLFDSLVDNVFEGVYYTNSERLITYWNKSAEQMTGYVRHEVMGRCCSDNLLRHVDHEGKELCLGPCPLALTLKDGQIRDADVYLHHRSGHRVAVQVRVIPVRDRDGTVIGAVEVFTDKVVRNETLQEMQRLKQEVYTDPLTAVGNRRFAEIMLHRLAIEHKQTSTPWGVLFFDIDHFKTFNDSYGHEVGDQVLRMTAKTASGTLRPLDNLCRWGGEEFVALVPHISPQRLGEIAERLRRLVERTWLEIGGDRVGITVSIGATMHQGGEDPAETVARADRLMYESKQAGRNRVSSDC